MSRLNEYVREFGATFGEEEDKAALQAWLDANPGLKPGSAGGGLLGTSMSRPAGAPPATGGRPPANPPAAPAGPPPLPPNFVPGPTPGSILRLDGFASMTLNPATNQYEPDKYAPSAVTLAAAGITKGGGTSSGGTKTSGGGSTTNYAQQNAQQKSQQQLAAGGSATLPAGAYQITPTRAVDRSGLTTWTKDAVTGNWTNAGFPPNAADKQAAVRVAQAERQNPTAPATPSLGTLPGSIPSGPNPTPTASPFMGQSFTPNSPNTNTSYLPGSVNNVAIQNPGTGFNGFINKSEGQRAPANQGFGPAVSSNLITFNQYERGYTPAERPLVGSITTPSWLDYTSGRNEAGNAVPYTMGVTPGPRADNSSLQSMIAQAANTFPVQVAGNNVQVVNPDKSTTGFVLNAMPGSNIPMAQGRNFEGLTPQQQAAATAMLLDEQMNGGLSGAWRTDAGSYIFGGGGGDFDTGMRGYAKGGRVATGPLGKPDQVTNEPIFGIGAITGRRHFVVGEGDANRDGRFDPEMLSIKPLPAYAKGGDVYTGPASTTGPVDPFTKGPQTPTDLGFTTGPIEGRMPTTPVVGPTTGPVSPLDAGLIKSPTSAPGPGFTTNPITTPEFDPLDPTILNPWSAAAQANRTRDANIRRFGYRGDFAGLAAPIAIQVEQGDVPAGTPGAGMYYDATNQVNRTMGSIIGAQEDYRNLPAAIDTNPLYTREGEIGISLGLFDDMRNLEQARVSAAATNEMAQAQAMEEYNVLNFQYDAENNLFTQIAAAHAADPNNATIYQQYLNQAAKIQGIDANRTQALARTTSVSPDLLGIDARLGALQQATAGLNEGTLQTERGLIRSQLSTEQSRMERQEALRQQIRNLAAAGVPKVSQSIVPVAA